MLLFQKPIPKRKDSLLQVSLSEGEKYVLFYFFYDYLSLSKQHPCFPSVTAERRGHLLPVTQKEALSLSQIEETHENHKLAHN